MPRQTFLGEPPSIDELRYLVGEDTYTGNKGAQQLKDCKKIWAEFVEDATKGRYVGKILEFNPADGEVTFIGIDMRETWSMAVVDPKSDEVIWFQHYAPMANEDDDSYHDDQEIAEEVREGRLSLAEAKKVSQRWAEGYLARELESWIEADSFYEVEELVK